METKNIVFSVEGNTNDLLQITEAHNMKRTTLVYFNPISTEVGEEVITVSVDSTNEALTFPIFDKLLNKKIRITVETIGEDDAFRNINNGTEDSELEEEYVDLGLPSGTKWMKHNIGAETEIDYGLYFQWGDTVGYTGEEAKKNSYWATCVGNSGARSADTTALMHWDFVHLTDNVLNNDSDAAYVHTNGEAKMPTLAQIDELVSFTNREWIENFNDTGISGMKFTNTSDSSKYIFIPTAGGFYDGAPSGITSRGCVWSSTIPNSNISSACGLGFGDSYCSSYCNYRFNSRSVRGVLNEETK